MNAIEAKSLEDLYASIVGICGSGPQLNVIASCQMDLNLLDGAVFGAVYEETAKNFMATDNGDQYYVSHGGYYGGTSGLDYIVGELKSKRDSNRALLDLCNQSDFIGSNDKPVPSFLIGQFGIQDNVLHYTAYYRALEASDFLKVNLEEARLACLYARERLSDLAGVRITIVAFRCYCLEGVSAAGGLRRCEFDYIEESELLVILQKSPKSLSTLLRERSGVSTVVEYHGFKRLLRMMRSEKVAPTIDARLLAPPIISAVSELAEFAKNVSIVRLSQSHSENGRELMAELSSKTSDLADLIDEALQ